MTAATTDTVFLIFIACLSPARPQPQSQMGANLTRPDLRHREAPVQTARQAAPDGGALGRCLDESSRFSGQTRNQSYADCLMTLTSLFVGAANPARRLRWLCGGANSFPGVYALAGVTGPLRPPRAFSDFFFKPMP